MRRTATEKFRPQEDGVWVGPPPPLGKAATLIARWPDHCGVGRSARLR
jgi:hypothetical protein